MAKDIGGASNRVIARDRVIAVIGKPHGAI